MRKNILFITYAYWTGEKIYPILKSLKKMHNIDVLNMYEMSKHMKWDDEFDPRQLFYKMCDNLGIKSMHGPEIVASKDKNVLLYQKYINNLDEVLKRDYYDLVIFEHNSPEKRMGYKKIYEYFKKQNIPFISCPHGNRNISKNNVPKKVSKYFDFSFVLGKKEKELLYKTYGKYDYGHYLDKVFPAGIPSNDMLKDYQRTNKHILVITNFTKYVKKSGFNHFTSDTFNDLGLLKLIKKYNRPIVIKEKHRMWMRDNSLRKSLKKYNKVVKFIKETGEAYNNKLIADSICVISAPSTLAFKSIQMGIPTVLLKGHGAVGNFDDFPGLINPSFDVLKKQIKIQEDNGRCVDFLKNNLEGSINFNSIDIYISYINKILNKEIAK